MYAAYQVAQSSLSLSGSEAAQVDARDAADRDQNRENLATGSAARDAVRPVRVDDRLGENPDAPQNSHVHVMSAHLSVRMPGPIWLPAADPHRDHIRLLE